MDIDWKTTFRLGQKISEEKRKFRKDTTIFPLGLSNRNSSSIYRFVSFAPVPSLSAFKASRHAGFIGETLTGAHSSRNEILNRTWGNVFLQMLIRNHELL